MQYGVVVVALALVAYAIHRAIGKAPPGAARRRAALDAFWTGVIAAPFLLFVIVVVSTVRECAFGTGC